MLGSPCQGPSTGLTPPISTSCPAHRSTPPYGLRSAGGQSTPQGGSTFNRHKGVGFQPASTGGRRAERTTAPSLDGRPWDLTDRTRSRPSTRSSTRGYSSRTPGRLARVPAFAELEGAWAAATAGACASQTSRAHQEYAARPCVGEFPLRCLLRPLSSAARRVPTLWLPRPRSLVTQVPGTS